jgi:hypothetical protein
VPLPDQAPASIANGPDSSAQSGEPVPSSATKQIAAASRSNPEDLVPINPSPRPVAAADLLVGPKLLRSVTPYRRGWRGSPRPVAAVTLLVGPKLLPHPLPSRLARIAAFLGAFGGLHGALDLGSHGDSRG